MQKSNEQVENFYERVTWFDETMRMEHDVNTRDEGVSLQNIADSFGVSRRQLMRRIDAVVALRDAYPKDTRLINKLILPGTTEPQEAIKAELPEEGFVNCYILTSAQNNTKINKAFWNNLLAFADHLEAEILVGTYTYSHNNNSKFTVKNNTNIKHSEIWWAEEIVPYISDKRLEIAPGLIWCGDWNIAPTATDPVVGLDSFNGQSSNIFPHAKLRQKSIGVQKSVRVKRNMTTGTVTNINYVQRKAGMKAEFDHVFSAVLVEVDHNGFWLHRQIIADSSGSFYDLKTYVSDGIVHSDSDDTVAAIVHGDIHAVQMDEDVFESVFSSEENLVASLNPQNQVLHDLLDFHNRSHHDRKSYFKMFEKSLTYYEDSVETEIKKTQERLLDIAASHHASKIWVIYSNHDDALERWLEDTSYDFRKDHLNAIFYLGLMKEKLVNLKHHNPYFSIWEHALSQKLEIESLVFGGEIEFVTDVDESVVIEGIEVGKHGHVGNAGARGSLATYSKSGKKSIIGHVHKAEIDNGAWSVGTYHKLWPSYAKGYNAWTHTCCVIYKNGKRSLIDIERDPHTEEMKWRIQKPARMDQKKSVSQVVQSVHANMPRLSSLDFI